VRNTYRKDSLLYHQNVCEELNNISNQLDLNIKVNMEDILQLTTKIEKIITESMLLSEKKRCKLKDTALWTPELYQSNSMIQ
jgi:hypothetical protein